MVFKCSKKNINIYVKDVETTNQEKCYSACLCVRVCVFSVINTVRCLAGGRQPDSVPQDLTSGTNTQQKTFHRREAEYIRHPS